MRPKKLIRYLTEGKFKKIWKGKDLESFYDFVRSQGIPAKGFLLTLQLKAGGLAWFFYKIEEVLTVKQDLELAFESIEVAIPDDETCREIPQELKGYPIWRL